MILDKGILSTNQSVSELTNALEALDQQMSSVASVEDASNVDEESLANLIANLKLLAENANESITAAELLDKRRQLDPDNVSFFVMIFI